MDNAGKWPLKQEGGRDKRTKNKRTKTRWKGFVRLLFLL
jgi:hypothetical protein